jgi:uncharacterized protein YbjT (DUF2867 family)
MPVQSDRPSVVVAGATGLIGRALLKRLAGDRNTGTVHALTRRAADELPASPRLLVHSVDYTRAFALPLAYECYIALGTTIKDAGSQEAFRAVDLDLVVTVAKAAKAAGVARVALVSALGANAESGVFYNRVKGLAEAAVVAMGFERLVIARPSLLLGNRAAIGQQPRRGERVAAALTRPLRPWISRRWRPIDDDVVARALVRTLRQEGPQVQVLESAELARAGEDSSA